MNLGDRFFQKILVSLLIIFVVGCASQESPAPTEILFVPISTEPAPTPILVITATPVPTMTLTPIPTETPWHHEDEVFGVYLDPPVDLVIFRLEEYLDDNEEVIESGIFILLSSSPLSADARSVFLLDIYDTEKDRLVLKVVEFGKGIVAEKTLEPGFFISSISPDGQKIALINEYFTTEYYSAFPSDLYIWDWQDDVLAQITHDEPGQVSTEWSPDSSLMAVVSGYFATLAGDGPIFGEILSIFDMQSNIELHKYIGQNNFGESGEPANVSIASFSSLQWNNDGSKLLFSSIDRDLERGGLKSDVCILNLPSVQFSCPTEAFPEFGRWLNLLPLWSSDESTIYFASSGEDYCYSVYAIDLIASKTWLAYDESCIDWNRLEMP